VTILLLILAVAFAAFCVWLTVRIVNRRERWAKRLAVTLVITFIIYPLSAFGVDFLVQRDLFPLPGRVAEIYCRPMAWLMLRGPEWATEPLWNIRSLYK
jgi:hypothetical protein